MSGVSTRHYKRLENDQIAISETLAKLASFVLSSDKLLPETLSADFAYDSQPKLITELERSSNICVTDIVYLLTNPTMPDLVKIGRTTDLESRLRSLSTHSGVPVPFECFYACEVGDSIKVEKALHDAFGDHRINPKREFFRLNPDRAVAILELVAIKDVTPTDEVAEDQAELDALHREQTRREQFRFSMVDIAPGAILSFSKDETITARVVDDKRIEFEGEITSTSAAATKLLHRIGWTLRAAQGPLYWIYEGETLAERRIRLEADGDD